MMNIPLEDQKGIIYKATGIWPEEGKRIRNPLRTDRNPGAWFEVWKDYLRIVDFADIGGTHNMNCWDIYCTAKGVTFEQAVEEVKNGSSLSLVDQPEHEEFRSTILWEEGNWTYEHQEYLEWYGIEPNGAIPIKWFKYNSANDPSYFKYVKPDFALGFPFGKRIKIYQPYQENRLLKWKSNCNANDIFFEDLQEKGEQMILTKSWKDGSILKSLGYTVRAVQSEGSRPHYDILKRWGKNFDKIYVVFDNDDAGRTASARFVDRAADYGNFIDTHFPRGPYSDWAEVIDDLGRAGFLEWFKNHRR
jgi:hypothetical protein